MNLVVIHYHVNRGGVTRVIENQLIALHSALPEGERWPVAILYGGRQEGFSSELPERLERLDVSLHEVPELEYDDLQSGPTSAGPAELLMALMQVLGELGFPPAETVLHMHNHSLGKNRAMAEVLPVLATDGYALLLQTHDFAEDFRPDNYASVRGVADERMLYPRAPHIHYAVLNGRDCDILSDAGIADDHLHLLPNPVPDFSTLPERDVARAKLAERFDVPPEARLLLYPVRCIRRKNMGEALLLGLLAEPETVVGLTLAPLNPVEVPAYEAWKQLAKESAMHCRFELGAPEGLTFPENLAAADAIVTTSLAEGFGMVFLEAWLAGRPLIGRDLPEITRDFRQSGVGYPWLYDRLNVPVAWLGEAALLNHLADVYHETMTAYGLPDPADRDARLRAKIVGGTIDFGDLDAEQQMQIVRRTAEDPTAREELLSINPDLPAALSVTANQAAATIAQNAATITDTYAYAPSGRRLLNLYQQVGSSSRDSKPKPLPKRSDILGSFLSPERFRPLRR